MADDDTVRVRPSSSRRPKLRRAAPWIAAAVLLVALGGVGIWRTIGRPLPAGPPALPVASESEILADRPQALTLFRFAPNRSIVVFDFAALREQGLMFNRVAAFAEKIGQPHDRVLTDAELDHAIRAHGDTVETYYYGHDYSAATLRAFFAAADRDRVTLGAEEEHLRQLAATQGLLAADTVGAIITLPREGADALVDLPFRRTILHHELSHGEYFSNPVYAAYAQRFWAGMDRAAQDAFRRFLLSQDYDPQLQDLTINETQAYLMHTPDRRAFSAEALGLAEPALNRLQAAFLLDMPPGWLRDCTAAPGVTATPVRAPRQRGTVRTRMACASTRPPRRSTAARAPRRSAR